MATRFVDIDRLKLYGDVWRDPISKVSASYGISNAEVKRAALALAVPLPPAGHWTKVEHKKGIATPPLPAFAGKTTYRHTWWVNEETEEVERRFSEARNDISLTLGTVPPMKRSIDECLPIIKKMAARLKKGHRDTRNWPTVGGYQGLFEVSVSPANQERALLTFDRILRHCQSAGLRFLSDETKREPAYLHIEGTVLTIRIFESGRREERDPTPEERARLKANPNAYIYRPDRYVFHPSNVLKLEVHHKEYRRIEFTIVDGADAPLADRIADLPSKLMACALKDKLRRDIRAEERRVAEVRREAHQQKVELKRKELERLKHYEELASQMERAVRLRGLAAEIDRCGKFSDAQGREKVDWIRNAADWLDPLVHKSWPVVDDVPGSHY